MKKKKKLFRYVVIGVCVILSILIIFIVKNYQLRVDDMWQKYENTSYNFKFYYPSSLNITTDNKSNSFNVYLQDGGKELFRIHVYKPEWDVDDDEFKIREEKINNNLFNVLLFPKGLDSGDFKLNQPILYYITDQGDIRYSFQFSNQVVLSPTQKGILSTFNVVK
ncbi:hypothetical protein AUK05_00960 [Candidatus Shapirobacteria bacterium CG2_30_35_20]|nr:MAG: hypothetical protein AUK05_00960 [Candidatus Shapirobacteria bacterium CG2_30_35_20]